MPGFLTNGLPVLGQVGPQMWLNVDTELPRGVNPQSVAASAFQVAAALGDCLLNIQSGTNTATSNTFGGIVNITSLATAPGDTFTFTLTNNLINNSYLQRGMIPEVAIYSGTNTGGNVPGLMSALMVLHSADVDLGRVVWIFRNLGNTPLNGTMYLLWHL